ncbi:MAG: nitroreductase family protein [Methylococcaceae bacterium]|nr:MAG: nitroreductase family protein [Methylococcaceae bacterium]
MDVLQAIEQRRAVKSYAAGHAMPAAEQQRLLSLALLSPTAFNIQHWRFVVVSDPDLRRACRAIAWDQAQATDASLFIVLCADLKAWEKNPARYWRDAPAAVQDFIVPAIDAYYRGNDQVQRDEAMRSCGIAAQTLMLAAKGMGYDSCPMDGFDFEAMGKLINLPQDHVIGLAVAIGKAVEPARARAGQLPLEEVVIQNRFA